MANVTIEVDGKKKSPLERYGDGIDKVKKFLKKKKKKDKKKGNVNEEDLKKNAAEFAEHFKTTTEVDFDDMVITERFVRIQDLIDAGIIVYGDSKRTTL